MTTIPEPYPARLSIDYPERLDRLTTLFRLICIIPIAIILTLLTMSGDRTVVTETGDRLRTGIDALWGTGWCLLWLAHGPISLDSRRAVGASGERVPRH